MTEQVIRITVNGKLVLTLEQAAARKGVEPSSMRGEISRHQVQPVASLDGKKKLYGFRDIDAMWDGRPGTGSPGKRRKVAG